MKKKDYLHFSSEDEDNGSDKSYVSSDKDEMESFYSLKTLLRFFYYLIHIVPSEEYSQHNEDVYKYINVLSMIGKLNDDDKVIWYWDNNAIFQYSEEDIQYILELIEKQTFEIYNRKTINVYEKDKYDTQERLEEFYILFINKKLKKEHYENLYFDCVNTNKSEKYIDKIYSNCILELFNK